MDFYKLTPNLQIRILFKDKFSHLRHIPRKELEDWFASLTAPDSMNYEVSQVKAGFVFLQCEGCIVVQEDGNVWNHFGPKEKRYAAAIDAQSIGNIAPNYSGNHCTMGRVMNYFAHGNVRNWR